VIDYYHPVEAATPRAIRAIQTERLCWTLDHAYQNSSLYRRKLDDAGVLPRNVETVDDISSLPFTTKEELRKSFPRGALATPMDEVSYFGITSGTTGNPIAIYISSEDAKNMASSVARAYHALGMNRKDVAQVMVSVPMAWMWENAFRLLGMAVINMGIGNARSQVATARDLGATVLVSTPSYLLHLAETAGEVGLNPAKSKVRILIPVAEPLGEGTRDRLEKAWGANAYDGYGCMEMANGFVECPEKNGHHIYADHYVCEVVDPSTGEPVEDGEKGEFVFTTLTRKATPLIRFRTGDIVHMESQTCGCGRTHPRIFLHGRRDDMIKVKGSSLFPKDLERAVMQHEGLINYQMVLSKDQHRDRVTIRVEAREPSQDLAERIASAVKGACNVTPEIVFAPPGSLAKDGKTRRILDNR